MFWFGILCGILFAYFAMKHGFYENWTMFFNIIVSVYVAIFLKPLVVNCIPAANNDPRGNTLIILTTAVILFAILHAISYIFFTGQFSVSIPKIFNTAGSGFLGFLMGLFVWSFVILLIYIAPISKSDFMKKISNNGKSYQSSISYLCCWSDLLNNLVANSATKVTTQHIVDELAKSLIDNESDTKKHTKPNEILEPNELKPKPSEKDLLGPPPDINFDDI